MKIKQPIIFEIKRNSIKVRRGKKMPSKPHRDTKNDYNRREVNDPAKWEE